MTSLPLAHVGGVPIEEGALAVAPVAFAFAVLVGARLSELAGWLRHRKRDEETQRTGRPWKARGLVGSHDAPTRD